MPAAARISYKTNEPAGTAYMEAFTGEFKQL